MDEKIANTTPEIKACIKQIKKDYQVNNKDDQANKEPSNGAFAVHQAGVYNTASNYKLRDSFILNSATTIHVVNDWVRFISDIKLISDCLYAGLYTEEIVGYGTAIVTINYPKGKKQIQLLGTAYVLSFYINLVCLQKLNDKGVY